MSMEISHGNEAHVNELGSVDENKQGERASCV